ncbi:helix-turn-helix transcriptional regulator [Campylobacter corcagiensis]|uniref:WYL domain-containing transcriptional regulator n=1 Tax=Campylobacter corcagiensis TaxID=1448857 RepID=A0A7M1LF00_9BACT|nr:WYL domain-containing transcriptional regulator [Campylobacter corcagiensis]QKF64918.1 transcriptional regulator (WYL domain) [Campylobacter corcagiensis]QOQ86921.1 WYL domain-containing transcriptional regulator [Campylobacter corcagiensis]
MPTQKTLKKTKEILNILKKSSTSEEKLCEIFSKDRRTIARYIKILKDDGINIRLENGIYKITGFEKDENSVIYEVIKNLSQNQGVEFFNKSKNLFDDFDKGYKNAFFIHAKDEVLNSDDLALFENLAKAIENKKMINFLYENFEFKVKPLKVAKFEGYWYLLCLDADKNDKFKKFHVKTIKNLSVSNESFKTSKEIETKLKNANSIWFDIDEESFVVELLVHNLVLKFIERIPLKTQKMISQKNDFTTIYLEISNEYEIVPFILRFIPFIRVISPNELNEKIKNLLSEYLKSI